MFGPGTRSIPAVDSAAAFKETFSHKDFKIHFVGVWDTVSSVGWIYTPLRLFNVAQNKTIATGRQALSIDERRCFLPGQPLGRLTAGAGCGAGMVRRCALGCGRELSAGVRAVSRIFPCSG